MMLKKGDPCYVRLASGEVVEAVYDAPDLIKKSHWVVLRNGYALAKPNPTSDTSFGIPDCRFVCMTGLNGAQQQSLGLKVKER